MSVIFTMGEFESWQVDESHSFSAIHRNKKLLETKVHQGIYLSLPHLWVRKSGIEARTKRTLKFWKIYNLYSKNFKNAENQKGPYVIVFRETKQGYIIRHHSTIMFANV